MVVHNKPIWEGPNIGKDDSDRSAKVTRLLNGFG